METGQPGLVKEQYSSEAPSTKAFMLSAKVDPDPEGFEVTFLEVN
jgi:hypothetical protein